MITIEEYLKAVEVIKKYRKKYKSKLITAPEYWKAAIIVRDYYFELEKFINDM